LQARTLESISQGIGSHREIKEFVRIDDPAVHEIQTRHRKISIRLDEIWCCPELCQLLDQRFTARPDRPSNWTI
jgi:hypothetical protein